MRIAKTYIGGHLGHHSGVGRDLNQQGHLINHGPILSNHAVTVDWPNSRVFLLASLDGDWLSGLSKFPMFLEKLGLGSQEIPNPCCQGIGCLNHQMKKQNKIKRMNISCILVCTLIMWSKTYTDQGWDGWLGPLVPEDHYPNPCFFFFFFSENTEVEL